MSKTYLLVNRISYTYIKYVSDYIWLQILKKSSNPTEFVICDKVNAVLFESGSVVFIIGEPFQKFKRAGDVKYVFLNFSVVTILGSLLGFSPYAFRAILKKRILLKSRLDCFDWLLDYWPTQTAVLKDQLAKYKVRVDSFPVAVIPFHQNDLIPIEKRTYDVCFVGGIGPRRQRILTELAKYGVKLSPTSGVRLEEMALDSRIVLNLHARKSNHLEIPRILGAYAAGSALVTEHCYGMDDVFPPQTYLSCKYGELPAQIMSLLNDREKLNAFATRGHDWLEKHHIKQCDVEWRKIIQRIETHSMR